MHGESLMIITAQSSRVFDRYKILDFIIYIGWSKGFQLILV